MTEENASKEANTDTAEQGASGDSSAPATTNDVSLKDGRGGILGIKAGMTQVYDETGNLIAVTVIDLSPNMITQVKNLEKDGYNAIQVGIGPRKEGRSKSEIGRLKALEVNGFDDYQEFRLPKAAKMDEFKPGQILSAGFVKAGDHVDVTAYTKGKGFQGVIKRHHFAGGMGSHGASIVHRMPGSLSGDRGTGKVHKGKKMAGRMGHKKQTHQNLDVIQVDTDNGLMLLRGSVPGARSALVTIRRAVKFMKEQGV